MQAGIGPRAQDTLSGEEMPSVWAKVPYQASDGSWGMCRSGTRGLRYVASGTFGTFSVFRGDTLGVLGVSAGVYLDSRGR
jgi:hypothetical protein